MPPLQVTFEESLGYSPEDAVKAIALYREYYHGMDSIGVLYGYGDEKELTTAGATYLAKSAQDIVRLVDHSGDM